MHLHEQPGGGLIEQLLGSVLVSRRENDMPTLGQEGFDHALPRLTRPAQH